MLTTNFDKMKSEIQAVKTKVVNNIALLHADLDSM